MRCVILRNYHVSQVPWERLAPFQLSETIKLNKHLHGILKIVSNIKS